MRTTLTLDDDLAEALKERAFRTRKTFKQVLNQTLRLGLAAGDVAKKPKRYRLKPVSLGGVLPGVNLDKALDLADALEEQGIVRKIGMYK